MLTERYILMHNDPCVAAKHTLVIAKRKEMQEVPCALFGSKPPTSPPF